MKQFYSNGERVRIICKGSLNNARGTAIKQTLRQYANYFRRYVVLLDDGRTLTAFCNNFMPEEEQETK